MSTIFYDQPNDTTLVQIMYLTSSAYARGVEFNTGSDVIGNPITSATFHLRRVGTIAGNMQIILREDDGTITVLKEKLNSEISTTFSDVTFDMSANTHEMADGDSILVRATNSDAQDHLEAYVGSAPGSNMRSNYILGSGVFEDLGTAPYFLMGEMSYSGSAPPGPSGNKISMPPPPAWVSL